MRVALEVELVDYDTDTERRTTLRRDIGERAAVPHVGDVVSADANWPPAPIAAVLWSAELDNVVVQLEALDADVIGPHDVAVAILAESGWSVAEDDGELQ